MDTKKEITIILIGCGIVGFALIILIIFPLFQRIRENSDILVSQGKELASIEIETRALEGSKQSYQALHVDEKISAFLINPEIDTDFIEFLENTAEISQVSAEILRYSFKKSKDDIWSPRGYRISSTAPFQNISEFIRKLETAPYLIEIRSLTMGRKGGTGVEGIENFNATLIIKTYTK